MSKLHSTGSTGSKSVKSLMGLAVVLVPAISFALPEVSEEKGWSGYVAVGASYTDVKSNTIVGNKLADFGEKRISSINQRNESTDDTFPAITGEARWTLGRRNQLFIGSSVEDKVKLDGVAQLGWRKTTDSAGTFQVSLLSTNTIPSEVWDDPYRVETDAANNGQRRDTDRDGNGARFQWDRIFGTNFEVQLTARDIDIDHEASGESACGGLDTVCARSLARDGDFRKLAVGYLFSFGENHALRPEISAASMNADGQAKDYDQTNLKLTYTYFGDIFTFISNVVVGEQDFDNNNPLYGDEQDSDIAAIDASLFYKLPTDSGRWQLVGNVLYGDIDSDIDFHDSEVFSVAALVQYRFGALQDVKAQKVGR
jgi:hypothetical protein